MSGSYFCFHVELFGFVIGSRSSDRMSKVEAKPRFGVFLCDGEFGEESEVSFGGLDPRRASFNGIQQWMTAMLGQFGTLIRTSAA